MKRRSFLVRAGGTVAAGSLAGCRDRRGADGTPTPATVGGTDRLVTGESVPSGVPTDPGDFDRIVNVEEAGADPRGLEPITAVLEAELADDTLLVFPDGRYSLDAIESSGLSNVGLVAADGATPTITPSGPVQALGERWIQIHDVDGLLVSGIDLDIRPADFSGRVMITGVGDFAVANLTVRGEYDVDGVMAFRFDVRDPDSAALVRKLEARAVTRTIADTTGVYVGRHHAGTIRFENCYLANFSDNGLYASAPGGHGGDFEAEDGVVHVEGGLFRNNNISNVRLGSTGSTVRGATVVVDERPPVPGENTENVRGIRLRGKSGQVVANCSVRFGPEAGTGFGAIRVHSDNGSATIRNTHVHVDRDGVRALSAAPPNQDVVEGPGGLTVESVRVTGRAGGAEAISLVARDTTAIRDTCIAQSGTDRDGVRFENCTKCAVRDAAIEVSGRPFVLRRSDVTRTAISTVEPRSAGDEADTC